MSPTCSSRFFVGRNTRSASAADQLSSSSVEVSADAHKREPGMRPPDAKGKGRKGGPERRPRGAGRFPVVCSPGCEGEEHARWSRGRRDRADGVVGCGGGERQDANEPSGDFNVEVVDASFPKEQKLGKSSDLVLTVRNSGSEDVPNLAVTVNGFSYRREETDLSDPNRPRFAVNGPRSRSAASPRRGRRPPWLRHGLREHLGVRPAGARQGADAALDRHRRGHRALQDRLPRGRRAARQGEGGRGRRRRPRGQLRRRRVRQAEPHADRRPTARPSSPTSRAALLPAGQRSTGRRGYFGKRSSNLARSHIEKALPRVFPRPAGGDRCRRGPPS